MTTSELSAVIFWLQRKLSELLDCLNGWLQENLGVHWLQLSVLLAWQLDWLQVNLGVLIDRLQVN